MTGLADISLKLTPAKLAAVHSLFDRTYHPVLEERTIRAKMAILNEVSIKIAKKAIDKPDGKKPFSFKLKYYEADVLEEFLRANVDRIEDEYSFTLASGVRDTLHQKLA